MTYEPRPRQPAQPARIVIIDDHELARAGLRSMLAQERDLAVVHRLLAQITHAPILIPLVAILVMTGLGAIFDLPILMYVALWALAIASTVTVAQRILTVRSQAVAAEYGPRGKDN